MASTSCAIVVGCFIEGVLRGVAERVLILEQWPASAEVALSVERSFQRQGIGRRLLGEALLVARNRFVSTVYMISLRENEPALRLAHSCGASIEARAETAEGRFALSWPNSFSLRQGMVGDGKAFVSAVFELQVERGALGGQRGEAIGPGRNQTMSVVAAAIEGPLARLASSTGMGPPAQEVHQC